MKNPHIASVLNYFNVERTTQIGTSDRWLEFCKEVGVATDSVFFTADNLFWVIVPISKDAAEGFHAGKRGFCFKSGAAECLASGSVYKGLK